MRTREKVRLARRFGGLFTGGLVWGVLLAAVFDGGWRSALGAVGLVAFFLGGSFRGLR